MRLTGQRGEQVDPGFRRVVQPRTRSGEQQREADVVGELGPGADPPRVRGDGRLFRLCGVLFGLCGVLVRTVCLPHCEYAGDECDDEEDEGADEEAAQAAVLALGHGAAGGDELLLDRAEVLGVAGGPVEGGREPGAAVELAVVAVDCFPVGCGVGEVGA